MELVTASYRRSKTGSRCTERRSRWPVHRGREAKPGELQEALKPFWNWRKKLPGVVLCQKQRSRPPSLLEEGKIQAAVRPRPARQVQASSKHFLQFHLNQLPFQQGHLLPLLLFLPG